MKYLTSFLVFSCVDEKWVLFVYKEKGVLLTETEQN
jgi:hypothetical protein